MNLYLHAQRGLPALLGLMWDRKTSVGGAVRKRRIFRRNIQRGAREKKYSGQIAIYLYFPFLHGKGRVARGNTTRTWLDNHYHHRIGDKAAVVHPDSREQNDRYRLYIWINQRNQQDRHLSSRLLIIVLLSSGFVRHCHVASYQ